jgi:hypothetical protein
LKIPGQNGREGIERTYEIGIDWWKRFDWLYYAAGTGHLWAMIGFVWSLLRLDEGCVCVTGS